MQKEITEQDPINSRNLPPGILSSELINPDFRVGKDVLPWVHNDYGLAISRYVVEDGSKIYLASAVGSSSKLVEAADAMTNHQNQITDNMFYSRIAAFAGKGYASNIETMSKTTTKYPIHVMRNRGGQRVYFGIQELSLEEKQPSVPVLIRLAVYDKNKQMSVMSVMSVLSGEKPRAMRRMMSK